MQPPTHSLTHMYAHGAACSLCHNAVRESHYLGRGAADAALTAQDSPRYRTTTLRFCVPDASKAHRRKVLPLPSNRTQGADRASQIQDQFCSDSPAGKCLAAAHNFCPNITKPEPHLWWNEPQPQQRPHAPR